MMQNAAIFKHLKKEATRSRKVLEAIALPSLKLVLKHRLAAEW